MRVPFFIAACLAVSGCVLEPGTELASAGLLECVRCTPDGRAVDGCSACPAAWSADQIAGQCDLDPSAVQASFGASVRSTAEWRRCMQGVITDYCCVDATTFSSVVSLAGLPAGLTPPSSCAQPAAAPTCGAPAVGASLVAREVRPNDSVSESITSGEADWYKINLSAGARLTVRLDPVGPGLDAKVGLYGPQLTNLATTGPCSSSDSAVLRCVDSGGAGGAETTGEQPVTSAGWLYVRVASYSSTTGTYTARFEVTNNGYSNFNGNSNVGLPVGSSLSAREVRAGDLVNDSIAFAGENDWYKINLLPGARLTVRNDQVAGTLDVLVGVYGSQLFQLATTGGCTTSDVAILKCVDGAGAGAAETTGEVLVAAGGWAYVRVSGYQSSTGTYGVRFDVAGAAGGQQPFNGGFGNGGFGNGGFGAGGGGGGMSATSPYAVTGTTLPCRSNLGSDMACRGNVNRQVLRGTELRGRRLTSLSWMMDSSVMQMAASGLEIEAYLIYSSGSRTGRVIESSRRRVDVFDASGSLSNACQRGGDGKVTCTARYDTDMTLQLPAEGSAGRDYFILELVGRPATSDDPSCGRYPQLVAPGSSYNLTGVSFGGYLQRHQWSNPTCDFSYSVLENRPDLDLAATVSVQ